MNNRTGMADLAVHHRDLSRALLAPIVLGLVLAIAPTAWAQGGAGASDEVAHHIVRPGDTLRDLAVRFYGDSSRWQEIAQANPQIRNPNVISPGQRLNIPLRGDLPKQAAQVASLARRVEAKPSPNQWDAAQRGDLLREKDGLRTYTGSSAGLVFPDGQNLVITEDSLVFLEFSDRRLRSVPRDQVELVVGQADLEAIEEVAAKAGRIELIVGDAVAKPKAAEGGSMQARIRRPETGGAQFMSYRGSSQVASAGEEVSVDEGMGTVVPEGKPPAPPEELLPAPQLVEPGGSSAYDFANPAFAWQPVDGAASYAIELCADPNCAQLVLRQDGLTETTWVADQLPLGAHRWRVTATAASGLDGYPSQSRGLEITNARLDTEPPTAAPAHDGPAVIVGSRPVLGPGASLSFDIVDPLSGPGVVSYLLNGQPAAGDSWSKDWPAGEHQIDVIAADRAGNRSKPLAFAFASDRTAPKIEWMKGGRELIRNHGSTEPADQKIRRRRDRRVLLEWSADGRRWLPILSPVADEKVETIRSDSPQVFIRVVTGRPFAPEGAERLDAGTLVRVWSTDDLAGVDEMSFRLVGSLPTKEQPDNRAVLVFESRDLVGNSTSIEWLVAGSSSPSEEAAP